MVLQQSIKAVQRPEVLFKLFDVAVSQINPVKGLLLRKGNDVHYILLFTSRHLFP